MVTRQPLMHLVQELYGHCAVFEKARHLFNKHEDPGWWPLDKVPFANISSMNKNHVEALLLAMLAKAEETPGVLLDTQMQLQQLRSKYEINLCHISMCPAAFFCSSTVHAACNSAAMHHSFALLLLIG